MPKCYTIYKIFLWHFYPVCAIKWEKLSIWYIAPKFRELNLYRSHTSSRFFLRTAAIRFARCKRVSIISQGSLLDMTYRMLFKRMHCDCKKINDNWLPAAMVLPCETGFADLPYYWTERAVRIKIFQPSSVILQIIRKTDVPVCIRHRLFFVTTIS